MNFPFQKILFSEEDTGLVAKEFSQKLNHGDVVCLNGNLGSGKTFFVKKICNYFEIDTASSPTFSIVNEYLGKKKIIHIDFYRIKKIEELYDIGIEDYFSASDFIVFIEWSEMFPEVLPKKYYLVNLKLIDDTKREIIIEKH